MMADQSIELPPAIRRPVPLEGKALLTYQAMSNSDDFVLLLEYDRGGNSGDAIVIGSNAAFRRATGYSAEQLAGLRATDLFLVENHAATLMDAIRGPGSLRTELACSRAGGGTFMLGMHLMPAPTWTPGQDCFVILGRDITAAIEARQMQDSIQHLLASVFNSVDAAVAIVNAAGRIVMTNRRIDLLLGYNPNGMVGKLTLELVAPDSRALVAANIKRQLLDRADATYSASLLRADGSQFLAHLTSVIATSSKRKTIRIITLRTDETAAPRIRSESVGRIKLIGLEEVRTALGDRWPALAERAMATAEAVIKRRCGPQDSYSRADDTGFLICFGALSVEESSFRAAMIGREIRSRLIGQGESPDTTYVRSIAAVVRLPDQSESDSSLHEQLSNGLDKQLERLERQARETLHGACASAACELEPILGRSAAQIVAWQVFISTKLERQLVGALAALPRKEADAFDQDGLLIELAARQAVISLAQGETSPLLVQISFDVFATRATTERFFTACARIDRRATARLVVLLSSLPNGLPGTRLQDCVNRLRPFCRGVGYQFDDMARLAEIDLTNSFNPIVVIPVTACGTSTLGKLKELCISLHGSRAKMLIRGVGSEKDATTFRSLGVDMISMKRPEA